MCICVFFFFLCEDGNEEQKVDPVAAMMAEEQLISYATRIQMQDIEILDNVLKDVDDTQQTANKTAKQVHEQTKQIQAINDTLIEIDGELDRAKELKPKNKHTILYFVCLFPFVCSFLLLLLHSHLFHT